MARKELAAVEGLTHAQVVGNIVAVYSQATEQERTEGMLWYRAAGSMAQAWATQYGLKLPTVAALFAILSPSTTWQNNVAYARAIIAHVKYGEALPPMAVYPHNLAKAIATVQHDTHTYCKGPKVERFMANFLGDYSQVTVDTHAYCLAVGRTTDTQKAPTAPARRFLIGAYVEAAAIVGTTPAQMQAATWVAWRRIRGVDRNHGGSSVHIVHAVAE